MARLKIWILLWHSLLALEGIMINYLENLENSQKFFVRIILNEERTYASDKLYKESQIYDERHLFAEKILQAYFKNKLAVFKFDDEHSIQNKYNSVNVPRNEKTFGQRCFT